jgi:hypothetical protein
MASVGVADADVISRSASSMSRDPAWRVPPGMTGGGTGVPAVSAAAVTAGPAAEDSGPAGADQIVCMRHLRSALWFHVPGSQRPC